MAVAVEDQGWRSGLAITLRVVAALGGGYALTAALVAAAGWGLSSWLGMAGGDAVVLSAMLGFLVFLGLLIWAFGERRLAYVCWVLLGGGLLAQAALWTAGAGLVGGG